VYAVVIARRLTFFLGRPITETEVLAMPAIELEELLAIEKAMTTASVRTNG